MTGWLSQSSLSNAILVEGWVNVDLPDLRSPADALEPRVALSVPLPLNTSFILKF